MKEYFEIIREDGSKTGQIKERSLVHQDGDLHATVHIWIVRETEEGVRELLLQKRSANKDAFPGCYDISSAGHVPAGEEYMDAALREMAEELGIKAAAKDLIFLGVHQDYFEEIFYGKMFRNREMAFVYLYEKELNIDQLKLQEEEVESVRWISFVACEEKMREGDPVYRCLIKEEIEMVKGYYGNANCQGKSRY